MDICAIIVFYKPNKEQIDNASRIAGFLNVIVIDNSSDPLRKDLPCYYTCVGKNIGIAAAQNLGIRQAKEIGAKRIVFLDQDSLIDQESINALNYQFDELKEIDPLAVAIGPLIVNKRTGDAYKNILDGQELKIVSSVISSGMLVDTDVYDNVGLLEESLFIDVVDHEWCWRCQSHGLHIYMTSKVKLLHEVGNKTSNFLGMQFIWSAPFRYYYKYRNSIWMLPRNYVPMKWKMRTIPRLFVDYLVFILLFLFKPSDRSYLKYSSKGVLAGFKGVFGR